MHSAPLARSAVAVLLAFTFLVTPRMSLAQVCDPDTEARLQFLETRLDEGQADAKLWWQAWMAVFTLGVVFSATLGALEDNNEKAAAQYVQGAKSILGVADLTFRPHVARHGAAPLRAIPKTTAAYCTERLTMAEDTMEKAAKMGAMRWNWKRHLWSLVLNLGAGIAIAEGADEPEQGWQDFGISQVSAEIHIWTHPTRAVDDWSSYRTEFNGAPSAAAPSNWRFAASPGGVGVRWQF
ncbi:MAG: hypothetical protein ABR538_02470 [Candidatus Binatia bacterium]